MSSKIERLSEEEILAILRAADTIIAQGGRTFLAKILKGSREKKVLQLGLDTCPTYGYFRSEKVDDIMLKVDWMIDYDFLDIQYSGKLPMVVFTERGWQIEANQFADEFLREWRQWLKEGKHAPDMNYLKDRNRHMILLFLEKIKETGNAHFIPFLKEWEKVEYKKFRAAIKQTITALETNETLDHQLISERNASIKEALKGSAPEDIILKCWECGNRFTFTIGEQQFYKSKGFVHPKRCKNCREKRYDDEFTRLYLW
ncbi:RQC-minor-1 family DNA-binding protein [Virgibacillus oceani]|uniref:Superfamily II DNA helicase n=1 Tax=Virgibacillus oceani TaxID=1479511 RepID=A0A917HL01_9BACI|nr:RQC-minor-1 family DNA-binding protein [Virgibacillus oceani]GGG82920.1 hypothetical protein GCM10011398_30590 [Virgibacillus oceani]